ncbi:MAG TPA: ABC transporter ATP-binding protein, partial [Pseudonocardia sp.]|nr:ABC transporter ATP-binding protein [Pseudonocardia sp.]
MTAVDDDWRGVAKEDEEPDPAGAGLRLQARARRLLGTLIRPHRWAVASALLLLVGQSAAELAGPLLVAYAIDTGIPAAVAGDVGPLIGAIGGYAGT